MSLGGKTKLGRSPDNPGGDTDPKKASEGAPENGRAGKVSRAATGPGTGPPDAESVEEAPHEEDDPLIGKVVGGNFRIKKLLGLGAMGKVYLAETGPKGTTFHIELPVVDPETSNSAIEKETAGTESES